jgi:hypothetical protein
MTNPAPDQQLEMLDVMKRAHSWIDDLQIAGISERAIVCAIHTALVERALRSGGVAKTAEWLQAQADMAMHLGPAMLAQIERDGR